MVRLLCASLVSPYLDYEGSNTVNSFADIRLGSLSDYAGSRGSEEFGGLELKVRAN